jgi:nucleotide-binding universal stress UspA family protein
MFKHVLVPLDYSALSEKALPYALHVLSPDGQLTLIVAVETLQNMPVLPNGEIVVQPNDRPTQEDLRKRAEAYFQRVIHTLPKPLSKIDRVVEFGSAADVIVDFAESSDVDVIVMCTHGRTGLSRWLMGSVTQKVLNASPCPIIVVPSKNAVKTTGKPSERTVAMSKE